MLVPNPSWMNMLVCGWNWRSILPSAPEAGKLAEHSMGTNEPGFLHMKQMTGKIYPRCYCHSANITTICTQIFFYNILSYYIFYCKFYSIIILLYCFILTVIVYFNSYCSCTHAPTNISSVVPSYKAKLHIIYLTCTAINSMSRTFQSPL